MSRPVHIRPSELEAGVVLLLGRRIVLCLHETQVPSAPSTEMGLVGCGYGIETVRESIRRVAKTNIPVLIRGETGTGKELVARALATTGVRRSAPFVAVNMAAILASTAAAELFGHEKGAFTGAVGIRRGYFGEADGGTLFLDEVGLAPPEIQAMLLRVLETREVVPVGGGRGRQVDVRLISATDANLEGAIASRSFSEPLFHRLAGFQITIPPLRRRREDFGVLLLHFLRKALSEYADPGKLSSKAGRSWLSASQVAFLAKGSWPGNVRALRNAAQQVVISSHDQPHATIGDDVERLMDAPKRDAPSTSLATGDIELNDEKVRPASLSISPAPRGRPSRRSAWEVTPSALLDALKRHAWSPTATAAALGVSRTALYALMERHPEIRKATDISDGELLRSYQTCGGDLDRLAETLCVSRRGLQIRIAHLLQESPGDLDRGHEISKR